MSTTSLDHLALSERHTDAHALASLAGTLADEMENSRQVHPDDADKPDLVAVLRLLADRLAAHRDALSELIDCKQVLQARIERADAQAEGGLQ
jgi:hypothetical protein